MSRKPTDAAVRYAEMATAEPDLLDVGFLCRRCRQHVHVKDDCEPAPLCDGCAQDVVVLLGVEVLRLWDGR